MDQTTNRKHIVEDWKIGLDAKRGLGIGDLLRSREIARLVKSFMDLDSDERKEMARRARALRETTLAAISDGGTSTSNLDSFLASFN
ncbi:hypothetical protein F511_27385 [Dorcoceras hygrometricum]|nr:hypothetical protein F511_27385 [Dorcoceras hygrometricum]